MGKQVSLWYACGAMGVVRVKGLERELKALANRRRLAILVFLKNRGEASVGEIAKEINLSFRSTSRHLAALKALDIVEHEQRSLQVFYRLPKNQSSATRHILSLL
jgi:DNA-binding transcriptional ArsR family regulator